MGDTQNMEVTEMCGQDLTSLSVIAKYVIKNKKKVAFSDN